MKELTKALLLFTAPLVWACGGIYLTHLMHITPSISMADYVQVSILVVMSCAVLVTVVSYRSNSRFQESEAYLEKAIDYANKAYEILQSESGKLTRNRVAWVSAARMISRSLELRDLITSQAHKDIYDSEHDYQRHKFIKLLKLDESGYPFTYFVSEVDRFHLAVNNHSSPWDITEINPIPLKVISIIFRFASFPEGYKDSVNRAEELTHKELEHIWFINKNHIVEYFVFKKHFKVIGDELRSDLTEERWMKKVEPHEVQLLLEKKFKEEFVAVL